MCQICDNQYEGATHVSIKDCSKVTKIPHMKELRHLNIINCPNLIEILVAVPTPISIPNANIIVIIGIVTPKPVMASGPTPGILPINILSTTLYNPFTIIPIIAGME